MPKGIDYITLPVYKELMKKIEEIKQHDGGIDISELPYLNETPLSLSLEQYNSVKGKAWKDRTGRIIYPINETDFLTYDYDDIVIYTYTISNNSLNPTDKSLLSNMCKVIIYVDNEEIDEETYNLLISGKCLLILTMSNYRRSFLFNYVDEERSYALQSDVVYVGNKLKQFYIEISENMIGQSFADLIIETEIPMKYTEYLVSETQQDEPFCSVRVLGSKAFNSGVHSIDYLAGLFTVLPFISAKYFPSTTDVTSDVISTEYDENNNLLILYFCQGNMGIIDASFTGNLYFNVTEHNI